MGEMRGKKGPLGISSHDREALKGESAEGTCQRIKDPKRLQGDCVFRGNSFLEDSKMI